MMQDLIDVLRKKEGELDSALRELANVQIAFEKMQHDIDALRSAVQLCEGNGSENGSEITPDEAVRIRAYELYARRGYQDGFDREDWQRAEAEILGPSPAAPQNCTDT